MSKENFEKYMHAFASIISMENAGCQLQGDGQQVCTITEEVGWDPLVYFNIHSELLTQIRDFIAPNNSRLREFVQRQLIVTDNLLDFQNSMYPPTSHATKISHYLNRPGKFTLYPWGSIDHQVYIDLWRTQENQYKITIFDLGAGREGERPVRNQYKPIQYVFRPDIGEASEAFINYVNRLITLQNAQPSINLYENAYGRLADRETCQQCMPEQEQTKGNCVVKNLLAAIQQDAIWEYGNTDGLVIFKEFYLALLKSVLQKADQHAQRFLTSPMPSLVEVYQTITANQISFTSTSSLEINNSISQLYNSISTKVTIPIPQTAPNPPPAQSTYGRQNAFRPHHPPSGQNRPFY